MKDLIGRPYVGCLVALLGCILFWLFLTLLLLWHYHAGVFSGTR